MSDLKVSSETTLSGKTDANILIPRLTIQQINCQFVPCLFLQQHFSLFFRFVSSVPLLMSLREFVSNQLVHFVQKMCQTMHQMPSFMWAHTAKSLGWQKKLKTTSVIPFLRGYRFCEAADTKKNWICSYCTPQDQLPSLLFAKDNIIPADNHTEHSLHACMLKMLHLIYRTST